MLIRYYKGEPSDYVIRYKNGRVAKHGPGLTFWYLPMNTSVAEIPVNSIEAPFIFQESTANFQGVSVQGSLSYRLQAPLDIANLLDFTVDPDTHNYLTEDPDALTNRVTNAVQANIRSGIHQFSLEDALIKVKDLADNVLRQVQQLPELVTLGVALETLHITAVKATPEMQKALEADYRESLQRRADQATYARRMAAVEEESKIHNREMDNRVELEQRRQSLVDMQARNNLALAEAEAKADEMKLNPYGNLAPQALVGLALKEWASNSGTISNLTLSTDLLSQLVQWVGNKGSTSS